MQLEIDRLWRSLHLERRRRRTPLNFDPSSNNGRDGSYKPKSRTPPNESFSYDRITIISIKARVHPAKVWAMTLWVGLLTRFLSHCLRVELKGENFLGGLLSQHSPCIIAKRTLWSTLATSTREWRSILRMKAWCAKYSHPIWGLWR